MFIPRVTLMRSRAKDRSTGVKLRTVLALVVVVAAGCSSVRLGYNNADTLLYYTLDKYLDLNPAQEKLARDSIKGLLAWHRATQLQGYAQLIDAAGRRVEGHIAPDDVLALNLEMNRRLVAIGERAASDLAALALTLQASQLERAAKKFADDDARARREVADGDASVEHRVERSIERADDWFGSVTRQQEALIRAAVAQRPDSEDWWLREREQRRSDLLKLLQRIHAEQPKLDEAAQWLHEYFTFLTDPRDPERRARMNEYRRGNAELIAALVNVASTQQKAVLIKKLHGYSEDFAALAADTNKRS
jgi:hypothetical protein